MSTAKKPFPILILVLLVSAAFAVVFCIAPSSPRAEGPNDILVIANKSIGATSISAGELKAIFLKKKESFGGGPIVPIHAKDGSGLRKAFQKRVLGMDGAGESSYWEEQKIKSGLTPPGEFAAPLKAVFSVKGGIGYCFRSDYKEGVANILLVL